jgi:hypothetical protein
MNANRRLKEFILKLSTKQNEHGLFDKINELKTNSFYNDYKMGEDKAHSKLYNKLERSADKQ